MSFRRAVLVLSTMIAILAGILWLDSWGSDIVRDAMGGTESPEVPVASRGAAMGGDADRQLLGTESAEDGRPGSKGWYLQFVDEVTGDPVPDVLLLERDPPGAWIEVCPESMVAKVGASGRWALDGMEQRLATLVAFALGYKMMSLSSVLPGDERVVLRRSLVTRVHCMGPEGQPIAGCYVVVDKRQRIYPRRLNNTAVGRPGSAHPVWSARSDQNGIATLRGIEPGQYRLHVFSAKWFSAKPRFQGQVNIDLPHERIDVPLTPMLGAVFSRPAGVDPGVTMLAYQASWESGFSRPAISVRLYAEDYLRMQHGDALVVFARGALSAAFDLGSVKVEMLLSNGAKCLGIADMVPLDEVEPTALTVKEMLPLRKVVIQVKGDEGTKLHLGLWQRNTVIPIVTGLVSSIPCGSYKLRGGRVSGLGELRWAPKKVTIPEGSGLWTIPLDIGGPARMVRIKMRLADVDCDEGIWLKMSHSNGDSAGLTPYALQQGMVDMLFPYGTVRFSAGTVEDGRVTTSLVIGKNTPATLELVIPKAGAGK